MAVAPLFLQATYPEAYTPVSLSSLVTPGTTFYFHTYATNNGGTTYGTENSFTLLPVSALLSVPVSGSGSLAGFGNVCINTGTVTNNFKLNGYLLNGTNISIGPLAGFSFSTNSGGPFNNTLVLTSPEVDIVILQALYPVVRSMSGSVLVGTVV